MMIKLIRHIFVKLIIKYLRIIISIKKICLNAQYLKKTENRINKYIFFYRYFKQFYYFKKVTKIIMKDLKNKDNSEEYKDILKFKLIHFSFLIKKN